MAPKRVRLLATSHSGCYTCKSVDSLRYIEFLSLTWQARLRHIKCDEERPTCMRCTRSGYTCQGYPVRSNAQPYEALVNHGSSRSCPRSEHSPKYCQSPARTLTIACITNPTHYRNVEIGLYLLTTDSFTRFGSSFEVLGSLLPQLCFSNFSVSVAVAALGCAYELETATFAQKFRSELLALDWYQFALRTTRKELSANKNENTPLVLSCLILGVVEILLQREENALHHLAGACNLLRSCQSFATSNSSHSDPSPSLNHSHEDGLTAFFRTIDVQTSSFALSKPPELASVSISLLSLDIDDLNTAHDAIVQLLHSCYSFTYTSYAFKYRARADISSQMYDRQNRLVAHLASWVEHLRSWIRPSSTGNDPIKLMQARSHQGLLLRVATLSALIHVGCALSPYETDYDAYGIQFQQIIAHAETIMSFRSRLPDETHERLKGHRFEIGPGIVEPLFMVAYKYRDPEHRRRAIRLLSLAGREGPWYGPREARITARIAELEERTVRTDGSVRSNGAFLWGSGSSFPAVSSIDFEAVEAPNAGNRSASKHIAEPNLVAKQPGAGYCIEKDWRTEIPEEGRINEIGFSSILESNRPSNRVAVRFTKCQHTYSMVPNEGLPTTRQSRHIDGRASDTLTWLMWTEQLLF